MINRALIRIKIVQIVYAYYQNGGKNLEAAEKELLFSISKAYDLYNYLLQLMVAVTDYEARRIELGKARKLATAADLNPNMRFVENRFIAQLRENNTLQEYATNQKRNWSDHEDFLKSLLEQIQGSELYAEYMKSEASYQGDREFWHKLYKLFVQNNEALDELLEEVSLYWNDDKEIVDTFVLKTINRFKPENGAEQELLPEYKDEEDRAFAVTLFRRTILDCDDYRKIISDNTRNWDLSRVAFMDVVIMQIALAELLNFSNIPVNVTLNEYVELAKFYSTPKSGGFVNGTLDGIVKVLRKDGTLLKN